MRSALRWVMAAAFIILLGSPARAQVTQPELEKKLLPVGDPAPDFDLPQVGGDRVRLSELTRKNVVLVTFWFYGCEACRTEFPHLQKMYDELKARGLEVVAINAIDSRERIESYQQEGKFTFRLLQAPRADGQPVSEVVKKYRVSAYPTNYLIGKDGKVLARFVGFNEKAVRDAIERAGVK
ncbi:MAG: TlpA family protein disulfide reductase [Armatimonadetes bacterium]|nr:TlpA family protein disulfide reductase [Armatimonadota bacterium]